MMIKNQQSSVLSYFTIHLKTNKLLNVIYYCIHSILNGHFWCFMEKISTKDTKNVIESSFVISESSYIITALPTLKTSCGTTVVFLLCLQPVFYVIVNSFWWLLSNKMQSCWKPLKTFRWASDTAETEVNNPYQLLHDPSLFLWSFCWS